MTDRVIAPPDPRTTVKAFVSVSPFSYPALDEQVDGPPASIVENLLSRHVGRPFALTNSGRHALDLILADLSLPKTAVVTILTTSGSDYVSNCVTSIIERYCRWSMRIEEDTAAIIAIHEWGRACERVSDHLGRGVPIIEDCAYAFATRYADGEPVGRRGDYALFSLTKMFSVNFGGLALAPGNRVLNYDMPAEDRNFLLRRIGPELSSLQVVLAEREKVWRALSSLFSKLGATPFFQEVAGEVPSVYMFHHSPEQVPLADVRRRFEDHGIEASVFYGSNAVFVPAHHRVGPSTRSLMFEIYRKLLIEHGQLVR